MNHPFSRLEKTAAESATPLKRLVLVGMGHTHVDFVSRWANRSRSDRAIEATLTCINAFDIATYSGALPTALADDAAADGWRIDLAKLCENADAKLITSSVDGISAEQNEVSLKDGRKIPFDLLSIGVGSVPVPPPVTAGSVDGESIPAITIKPMQTFIRRFDGALRAIVAKQKPNVESPIRIVVVGGGAAGIEIALAVQTRLRRRRPNHTFTVELATASAHIGDGLSKAASGRIERILRRRCVEIHTDTLVQSIEPAGLVDASGRLHRCDAVIWATGASPPSLLRRTDLALDDRGFIATRPTLQTVSHDHIFAVGDCATMIDRPHPKAGVYAVRQSPILWHNLAASFRGERLIEFEPQANFLKLINTADGSAVIDYHGFAVHARWVHWLKRWIDRRFVAQFLLVADAAKS